MKEAQIEKHILQLRPDLTSTTLHNWASGMAGCTMQTEADAMMDLLTCAQIGRPMPWEQVIDTPNPGDQQDESRSQLADAADS